MHPKLLELESQFSPSPLTQLLDPVLKEKQLELWVKRDDLIHPVISGNKWRKLKYILDHALSVDSQTFISMGGAFSNHLHALAYVGKQLNLKTIGYIRGERPKHFSPTLLDLENWGMELRFVSRTHYRELRNYKRYNSLPNINQGEYWLPEGGATNLALKGVGEIITECKMDFDCICVPCGTGTTLTGLVAAIPESVKAYGFSALKGGGFLRAEIEKELNALGNQQKNWDIQLEYHFGGFAKQTNDLSCFIEQFSTRYGIELDAVYTGKMFYGLFDLIKKDYFEPGQKIIAIHTGGLQGNRKD